MLSCAGVLAGRYRFPVTILLILMVMLLIASIVLVAGRYWMVHSNVGRNPLLQLIFASAAVLVPMLLLQPYFSGVAELSAIELAAFSIIVGTIVSRISILMAAKLGGKND